MKQLLTLFIIFFRISFCISQTYLRSDFSPHIVPKVNSAEWYKLDTAKTKSFSVSIAAGKLQIVDGKRRSGIEYPFPNGKLLAFDLGEWGGGLYYQPFNAPTKNFFVNGKPTNVDNNIGSYNFLLLPDDPTRKLIKGNFVLVAPGNVQAVVPYKNCWLIIQGLAHMGQNYGSLSKLNVQKDSFTVSKIVDLNAAPAAMAVYQNKIFIATYNSFYCISNWNKEVVLDNLFWEGLAPNSIAIIDERNIFIGIHGGYAKIDLLKKDLKLFIYNK